MDTTSFNSIVAQITSAQKAVQAVALSAETALTMQKEVVEAFNVMVQTIQHQNEEITKLKAELEKQKSQQATTEGCRVLTPEEVARHDSELDPKEYCD